MPVIFLGSVNLFAPTTSYANAGGTGDRTASITVTSSATLGGGGPLSVLVNGSVEGAAPGPFFTVATENGMWLKFDFGVGVNKYIDEIKWYKQNLNLEGTWYYEASHDDSVWVTVSTADFSPGTSTTITTTCLPPEPEGYRYYRLHHRTTPPTNNPRFYEFEFKIAAGA